MFSQEKCFLIFQKLELFKKTLYILENGIFWLQAQAWKIKKIYAEKNSFYFRKWNFRAIRLKKNYVSSKENFSYIPRTGTLQFLRARSKNKKDWPPKKFLMFQEMELSASKIKTFLIFSQKKPILIFPEMKPCTF